MWTYSHTIVTSAVTKEQMWKLISDVNNWTAWDESIEYARLLGPFVKGNFFTIRPKGGPEVRVQLLDTVENSRFLDLTQFLGAKMYGDHHFEETSAGLKITYTLTVKGALAFLWRKLVVQKMADHLPEEMEIQIKFARAS